MSCVFRHLRRRSCFAWSTLAAWTPHCVKRCGLSCWVIISLECRMPRGRRSVVSTIMALLPKHFPPQTLTLDPSSLIPHPSPQVDEQVRVCYQQTMREWLGCEEIVRQREKEQHAVALAKCSTGVSMDSSSQKLIHRDSTVSNEVKQRQTHLFRVTDCAHRNVYSQCRHFKKESAVYVVSLISFLYRKVTVYKA